MCRKMRLKAQHRFDASHIEKHIRIDIIQYELFHEHDRLLFAKGPK